MSSTQESLSLPCYLNKSTSIHKLFSKFDSDPHQSMVEADSAFRSGINPNAYDKNGLTIFHTCVIKDQFEGIKYLFEVNRKNPRFLDLETTTANEGKNIFHLSVFLKKLKIAKFIASSGFPLNSRDKLGCRAINLVDQNYEFLFVLKKAMKGKKNIFVRHPQRF